MMFYMQVIIAHGTLNQIQLRNIITPFGKPEHLDYIFTDKDHKQPKQLVNEVVTEKPKPWDVYAFPYYYVYNDFSDHYPIKAYSK